MKKVWIVIIVIVIIVIVGYFAYRFYTKKKSADVGAQETQTSEIETKSALDPQKEATHLSKVMDTKGVYWMRGSDLVWEAIEPKKGQIDWSSFDQMIKDLNQIEVYPLVIVKPFANWDQDVCHPEAKYEATTHTGPGIEKLKVGKPCDMKAYQEFLASAVERYDGDGIDDMPGLKVPIKYWEIINEPSMQGGVGGGAGEELKFFVGSSEDYLETLKASYQAIKQADSEAKVAHAGMAGMDQTFQNFWDPIFSSPDIGNYFDIANIHTINTNEQREDLYMVKFLDYLGKFGLENKPIWITEVQYGELMGKPADLKSFDILMAKSTAFSLALGADKLFYIDNWTMWDQENNFQKDKMDMKEKEAGDVMGREKKEDKSLADKSAGLDLANSSTHKVYLNLVDKLNNFDQVEIIKQEYKENPQNFEGATSQVGQYKFYFKDKAVYVLWGNADLPQEISGKINVTDIYGKSQEIESSELKLSVEPVFVEVL